MTAEARKPEVHGNSIFPRLDSHDRITDRFWKKIELLDQRLSKLEKRGWS